MKKLLFSLVSLILFCTASAQNSVFNGDLNNDGKFSVADIVALNNIVVKKVLPKVIDGDFAIGSAETKVGTVLFGDMDHDGKFTIKDIKLLAETFLEIKEEEPVTGDFEVREIVTAELVDGKTFSAAIKTLANGYEMSSNADDYLIYNIVFDCGSAVSSGQLVSTTNSQTPIYASFADGTITISTAADVITTTDMYYMFGGCTSLTSLDLSHFDTSNATYMSDMFRGCRSLTSLDLSNFDTSNVTDMYYMFGGCSSLTSLDLSNFDTSNVTDMISMFWGCSSLTSLDLSHFDTSNVTYMYGMFRGCSSLTSLDLSHFDTSNVTNMSEMFGNCSSLTSLDLSNFDTSNVTSMFEMFSGCSSLTTLDLSGFDTSNVTKMYNMFSGCSSLTTLDLSHFDTSNVMNMGSMFRNCSSLTSLDLSNFDTSNVTGMDMMFYNCRSLTSLDLSNFDTSNVTNMNWMCSSLASNASSLTIKCNEGTKATMCESDANLDQSKVVWDLAEDTNLWSAVESGNAFLSVTSWFSPSDWSGGLNPEWSNKGNVWKVTMPEGIGDNQWQGQFLINTSLSAKMGKKYNFSCILEADHDCKGVTMKLYESSDAERHDDNYFFVDRLDVAANKPSVYTAKNVSLPLNDAHALTLVFDFGGTPAGTTVKISEIYFEEVVAIRYNDEDNLWKQANASFNMLYYVHGRAWDPLPDYEHSEENGVYTLHLPTATDNQGQAQYCLMTDLTSNIIVPGTKYDFACTITSSKDLPGVTLMLTDSTTESSLVDNHRSSVAIPAMKETVIYFSELEAPEIEGNYELVFDFGGNPDDTQIEIKDIVIIDHSKNKASVPSR